MQFFSQILINVNTLESTVPEPPTPALTWGHTPLVKTVPKPMFQPQLDLINKHNTGGGYGNTSNEEEELNVTKSSLGEKENIKIHGSISVADLTNRASWL